VAVTLDLNGALCIAKLLVIKWRIIDRPDASLIIKLAVMTFECVKLAQRRYAGT
jgi:hypothetical protein